MIEKSGKRLNFDSASFFGSKSYLEINCCLREGWKQVTEVMRIACQHKGKGPTHRNDELVLFLYTGSPKQALTK